MTCFTNRGYHRHSIDIDTSMSIESESMTSCYSLVINNHHDKYTTCVPRVVMWNSVNTSLYLQAVIKATSSLKLERKCSYFTRYRKWFEEMRQSALQRHISLTSLSIKSDGEEELYNPEEIIVVSKALKALGVSVNWNFYHLQLVLV